MMVETVPCDVLHSVGIVAGDAPVYYERIAPRVSTGKPAVLMLHGGSHSGSCYQLTADGRPGWAYKFAQHGFPVYVPDWPGCGRSGAIDPDIISGEMICQGLARLMNGIRGQLILLTHSMGGALGWRLLELAGTDVVATVGLCPGPPGNIQEPAQVESETPEMVTVIRPNRRVELRKSGMRVNDPGLVRDKLIGASQRFPSSCLASYTSSLIGTPNSLIYERLNVNNTQVRLKDPAALAGQRILVVTPTHDTEHPREFDQDTVDWLNANGAHAQLMWLGDVGIEGNGHMALIEPGSDEIAEKIVAWIESLHIPPAPAIEYELTGKTVNSDHE
jgi:pimeloyl-ACP methyl ester carboxylesterase